jgi:hypothetical protein
MVEVGSPSFEVGLKLLMLLVLHLWPQVLGEKYLQSEWLRSALTSGSSNHSKIVPSQVPF